MNVALWRIAVDAPGHEAHDLGGKGSESSGGRWNRKGRPLVYASTTVALALLETVVHLRAAALPLNRYLVRIEVPDDIWSARKTWTPATLPVGWDAIPEGKVSLDIGEAWLIGAAEPLLEVPSVIVPDEFNVLVNPLHPVAAKIEAAKVRRWQYDSRIGR